MPPAVPKPVLDDNKPKEEKGLTEDDIADIYKVDYDNFDFLSVLREELELEK